MVFTDFSFLREHADPALVPVMKQLPPSPVVSLSMDPVDDDWDAVTPLKRPVSTALATLSQQPKSEPTQRSLRLRPVHRSKSHSECGPVLERMTSGPKKARPYSAGDVEDIRRVTISGFSKSKSGTWTFKVNVGTDEFNSYAIRRRFSDFKELHDGLQELIFPEKLPELPHHGVYSVMQLFFSPEPALSHRARKLEELLQFVNKHALLSMSMPFTSFLGKNPSSLDVGYVSLSCYEAPNSDGSFRLYSARGNNRSRRQSS